MTVTRHWSLVLAKEPCNSWRLLITTSPGADHRHRIRQIDRSGLRDLCLDINLAELVGTGDDPDAILGRTAVYLAHHIEPRASPGANLGLSQCVVPSWCHATDAPRPGALMNSPSV